MTRPGRRWLWLGAGAILLGLIFYNWSRTPEWRGFSWSQLWSSIVHARPVYLLWAVAAAYATYLVRAYRWHFLMHPIKKASPWILFVGQVLGFSSVFLIGRPGEFVRPAYIARKENVAFASMAAVWLLERIFDMVAMVGLFAAALYLLHISPATAHGESVLAVTRRGGALLLLLTVLVVAGTVAFRFRGEALTRGTLRAFGFLPAGARGHLENFLHSFSAGLEVIRKWRDFLASAISTAALWILNTYVFWLVFKAVGGGLERLSWLAAALTAFLAALGLVVQFPGIGGGYQVGALLALTELLGMGPEVATGAAILVWIIISVPCLALGAVLLIHEGLTFRKLRAMAEEQRQAAGKKP